MIVECTSCKARYRLDETRTRESEMVRLKCNRCQAFFTVTIPKTPIRDAESKRNIEILIAHAEQSICDAVEDILRKADFGVTKVFDGVGALKYIEGNKPAVAVLDVALPGMYGFEVCEHVKGNSDLKNVKIILLASIYDKTRYKRSPVSLYGADDYIEKHHVPDFLVPKIQALTRSLADDELTKAMVDKTILSYEHAPDHAPLQAISEQTLRSGEGDIADQDKQAEEKARRLARIIVSDIALYNNELVNEGVREGTLYKLIRTDIIEGLEHFRKKVPPHIPVQVYLKAAFEEFVVKRKKEMGLA